MMTRSIHLRVAAWADGLSVGLATTESAPVIATYALIFRDTQLIHVGESSVYKRENIAQATHHRNDRRRPPRLLLWCQPILAR
jgi:hypothetical protein